MQTSRSVFLFCLFLFIISSNSPFVFADEKGTGATALKSASEFDYPPFAIVRPDGKADGFSVDLMKAAASAVGLDVKFTVGPWYKIKQELIEGRLEALPFVSYSKERDRMMDFTAPYLRMRGTIFVRKGETSIRDERDLKNKEVLVMRGDTAHEYAVRKKLSKKLILTDTFEEAMTLLSQGRHDAVIVQKLMGYQLIKQLKITNVVDVSASTEKKLKPAARPLSGFEQKFCIAVPEGRKELLSLLNEGLTIVIANGTYEKLYNKWFGPILPKPAVLPVLLAKYLLMILAPFLLLLSIFGIWYFKKELKRKTESLNREIIERRKAEKALQESNADLMLAQRIAKIGSWKLDPEIGVPAWSEQVYRIYERNPASGPYPPSKYPNIYQGRHWELFNTSIRNAVEHGIPYDIELKLVLAPGIEKWINAICEPESPKGPEGYYLRGTIQDISDHKMTESKLQASEERYRKAQKIGKVGNWEYDIQTDTFWGSEEARSIYGFGPYSEKFSTEEVESCIPERERVHQALVDLIEEDKEYNLEFDILTHDKNERKTIISIAELERDPEGNPVKISGVIQDITKRKASEEALRKSEEQLRAIFQAAENISFIITDAQDPEPLVQEFSPGAEKIFGYKRSEIMGKPVSVLHLPEDVKNFPEIHQKMRAGKTGFSGEATLVKKSGEKFPALFTAHPLFDQKGDMTAALGVSIDISEQQALESRLRQSQKMESVGRLAGGVAHDFNNMLTIILGHTELILEDINSDSPFIDSLREVHNAAERSASLTRQLLAFARKQTIAPEALDINKELEKMLKMLKRLIGEDIDLEWIPGEAVWPVRIDPSQVDQLLANLCVNSRDAIKGVGKVTIETGSRTFDEAYCLDHAGFHPGDYVMTAVSDNGCGMEKNVLENLFEPFFTTKRVGEGSGLGLSTVFGIVRQNEGFINVYSEPGEGTTFKIYLPRHQIQTEAEHRTGVPEIPRKGDETILLVEDEEAILNMTMIMLERLGYKVLPASSPEKAVRTAENITDKGIHLLMTDVIMPEMNGRDLSEKILGLHPDLKCLFMSGYTANVIAHHGVLDEDVYFISKPFSKQELAAKLREVFETAE